MLKYPTIKELLPQDLFYSLPDKARKEFEKSQLSPKEFLCLAVPYLEKKDLWARLWEWCEENVYNPCEVLTIPSGEFPILLTKFLSSDEGWIWLSNILWYLDWFFDTKEKLWRENWA